MSGSRFRKNCCNPHDFNDIIKKCVTNGERGSENQLSHLSSIKTWYAITAHARLASQGQVWHGNADTTVVWCWSRCVCVRGRGVRAQWLLAFRCCCGVGVGVGVWMCVRACRIFLIRYYSWLLIQTFVYIVNVKPTSIYIWSFAPPCWFLHCFESNVLFRTL